MAVSFNNHLSFITLIVAIPLITIYLTIQGCGKTEDKTLKLFCGGGIRPPINEIIELFKEETGIEVKPNYAGSGVLLTQIQLTQDGDLYMPGDEMFMLRAEEKGYITEKKFAAYFIPVLMVQKGNPKGITSLADMGKADVRVGVGDPEACAVGEITKAILEKNGLESQVRGNVVYTSATVVELANAVKLKTINDRCRSGLGCHRCTLHGRHGSSPDTTRAKCDSTDTDRYTELFQK